jgi:DnaJ-class molecular chaperone
MSDPYQVLGVARDAKPDEIKRAYRKLAKELHPDLNPGKSGLETRFKEVTAAYELLSDPAKRARFDKGEIDASGAETAPRGYYRSYAGGPGGEKYAEAQGFEGFEGIDDVLADLFGGARGGPGSGRGRAGFRARGVDASYEMTVDFLDAVKGARKRITLPEGRTLDVDIPPGSTDSQTLRLTGQGGPGHGEGARAGDAYLTLHVRPHPTFERREADIHVDIWVTLPEAVLGARIEVPTIDGPVALTIPKGSSTGKTMRLKGKGVPGRKGTPRGDQYVTLKVALPEKPDDELTEFLDVWRERHPYTVARTQSAPSAKGTAR